MADVRFRVWRGNASSGAFVDYDVPVTEGWVVLDAIHWIQAQLQNDLAVRWNCKAGKCGSCSAEINGKPRLMCMSRIEDCVIDGTITVQPMATFPPVKDLVTDVAWNYTVNQRIPPLAPKPPEADGTWRMQPYDVDRVQEFRKCIECFLCQDVCHVLRDHQTWAFGGPRFMVRTASLEMHPLDTGSRLALLRDARDGLGLGYCTITKCCTEVCPEGIHITDNAIIPLKERVVGEYFDPLARGLTRILGWTREPRT